MTTIQNELRPPALADVVLVVVTCLLVAFSLLMVYSTTGVVSQEKFGDAFYFVKKQGGAAVLGFGVLLLCTRIAPERLRKLSPLFLIAAIGLLFLTWIPGVGHSGGGARRWISLYFFNLQPGEFAKVAFVIFMAGYFERHEASLSSFKDGIVKPLLLCTLLAALLLLQPDFGSTVVIYLVTLIMAASTGARLRYIILSGVVLALALGSLVIISPYRMSRILSFMSPASDASGRGYQLIQSLIAVGTGQLTGLGLGESQQKLFFLPAAHTDFIFAVVAEELGFLGCLFLIALFIMFLWRSIKISKRLADDAFRFSLAVGLSAMIVVPAFINIGVVIGLLPTKGMVLPLVGYGGSSLISSLMAIGIILSLSRGAAR